MFNYTISSAYSFNVPLYIATNSITFTCHINTFKGFFYYQPALSGNETYVPIDQISDFFFSDMRYATPQYLSPDSSFISEPYFDIATDTYIVSFIAPYYIGNASFPYGIILLLIFNNFFIY